jgi:hypothetical protein
MSELEWQKSNTILLSVFLITFLAQSFLSGYYFLEGNWIQGLVFLFGATQFFYYALKRIEDMDRSNELNGMYEPQWQQ